MLSINFLLIKMHSCIFSVDHVNELIWLSSLWWGWEEEYLRIKYVGTVELSYLMSYNL